MSLLNNSVTIKFDFEDTYDINALKSLLNIENIEFCIVIKPEYYIEKVYHIRKLNGIYRVFYDEFDLNFFSENALFEFLGDTC